METTGLREYILPLRRWWWLILASTLVAGTASFFVTLTASTLYESRATVMVGGSIRDPNPDGYEFYLAQQLVNTYVDLVQRDSVRGPAMAALGVAELPQYTARAVPNTQLMELKIVDSDPERGQAILLELINQLVKISPAGAQDQTRTQFVEQELDSMQAAIVETKAEIDRRQTELGGMFSARQIADAQSQIAALENKLASLQNNFTALLSTTQKGAVNTLTVVEQPSLGTPVASQRGYQILLALAIGFLLAAGGAYLIEYLDNSFKNSDEVRARLNLATLGAIPVLEGPSKEKSLVMFADGQSGNAESFRVLRTNLQFTAVARPLSRLLITSALPGEGKSFVCANLAIASAQAGNRVILVDCDLHRPRQHKLFNLVNNYGLTTSLLAPDTADPMRFLQGTALPTLRVLTTGPLPPNPAELIGSQRMHELLERLQGQADILYIDSPPASVLADTAVLSAQSDGVLLVLQVGKTSRDVAKRTLAALEQVHAYVVGVVLNRMPTRRSGYYYHYYNYEYSKKYYRRGDKLTGEAVPVTPAVGGRNGNGLKQGVEAKTGDPV